MIYILQRFLDNQLHYISDGLATVKRNVQIKFINLDIPQSAFKYEITWNDCVLMALYVVNFYRKWNKLFLLWIYFALNVVCI